MKAFIFAAGLGTRLKPLTDTRPKALVEVDGKPLLFHILKKLEAAKCTDVVMNIHHFGAQIIAYLKTTSFQMPVRISDETAQLLNTGGALKGATALYKMNEEPILIHNVDILSNLDLRGFYLQHKSQDLATLLVSQRETSRYLLFNDEMHLVGWTNIKTGEVKSPYPYLEVKACKKMAFSGIHTIAPTIFALMTSYPSTFSIIDFYLDQCINHTIKGIEYTDLQLMDVGKLDTLDQASAFLQGINQKK